MQKPICWSRKSICVNQTKIKTGAKNTHVDQTDTTAGPRIIKLTNAGIMIKIKDHKFTYIGQSKTMAKTGSHVQWIENGIMT